jgi:HEPN domain-containing protein
MTPRDLAAILLAKAHEDAHALDTLAADPEAADWIVGFHAQQAVEKGLKAVLTAEGIRAGRTHDLEQLLRLLVESPLDVPGWLFHVRVLRRYEVIMRYIDVEPAEPLDRRSVVALVDRVLSWASDEPKDKGPSHE